MTVPTQENQTQANQPTDKELNFRALENRYKAQLEQERQARLEAEQKIQQYSQRPQDEEEDTEPYVDHKKLNRTLAKHGQTTQSEIQKAMEYAKQAAKEELKQEMWLENNPDFYEVLKHADKFADRSPKLANSILRMPEGFERQKLVYENIKELGIDKPAAKIPTIQDKIDSNRRSPYYQPSGVGTSPYSSQSDFSASGQKTAYEKMKALQKNLNI